MPPVPEQSGSFRFEGQRLAYRIFGEGERVTVLLHGLLLNQKMHAPLARALAERGHRVVTLDLLGHGASDRPRDMWRYGMPFFGEQTVALLDHLGVERAVVGGTSLGANVALEVASRAPERLQGMIVEMPVLDNALLACAVVFAPMLVSVTFGEPVMRLVAKAARLVPEEPLPLVANIILDSVRQDPGPSGAVLQGLFFNRVAPHRRERRTFGTRALVIGHRRDPVHPFSDSDLLVREMPNARLLEAESIFELRAAPRRLTDEIGAFVDECWAAAPARGVRPRRGAAPRTRGRTARRAAGPSGA